MPSYPPLRLKLTTKPLIYCLEQLTLPWNKQKSASPPLQTPVDWTVVTPIPVTPVRDPLPVTNIKFTAYGIPYPVEFANIILKRAEDTPPAPPPKPQIPSHDRTIASQPQEARVEAPAAPANAATSQGVFIWYASQGPEPPKPMATTLLNGFMCDIRRAVSKVGMQSGAPVGDEDVQGVKDRFFKGTYGQVMEALTISGMAYVPCSPEGPQGATRLGSIMVTKPLGDGRVEINPIYLWA